MLMKGIITFISSNHKIQVNLLGLLVWYLEIESSFINQGCNASATNIIPLILCKPPIICGTDTKKRCISVMNEITFPPKGKPSQFSSYLASYQLIS